MSDLNERIRALFSEDIEHKIGLVDVLSHRIAAAGQYLIDCLLADGKIFIAGHGGSAANCLHFSAAMLHCLQVDRPSLPVINLAGNGVWSSLIADNGRSDLIFSQQIQALAQTNDIVMVLSTTGRSKAVHHAIKAAHDKQLRVIALSGRDGGELDSLLDNQDLELRIPGHSNARIRETHLFVLHCFCDLIDRSLFGWDTA